MTTVPPAGGSAEPPPQAPDPSSGSPAQPPAGQPPRSGISPLVLVVVILAVLVVAGGVVIGVLLLGGDEASAEEVQLEPVSSSGANPFMPSVGTDQQNVTPPQGSGGSYSGSTAGLYGGTRNISSCDASKMVIFLEQNPDKARAWSEVIGINSSEIRTYVSGLTSVVLRSDVTVTNHGYSNGSAYEIPAVLQAGTAVLVDRYGVPVVKCYCGNPLTAPRIYEKPRYAGTPWSWWNPGSITIIQKSVTIIDTFTLVDPATGEPFTRPAGTNGGSDQPAGPATSSPPGSTPPETGAPQSTPRTPTPSSEPPETAAPSGPTPEQQARNKVDQAASQCYPFPAPIEDSTSSSKSIESDNGDTFVIKVVTQTVDGGTQTFRWRVDKQTGDFTPLNDLAQVASSHCSLLN